MIKLISTGYSENDSYEEIYLDDNFNIVKRGSVKGIENASFAVKGRNSCFVSEEKDKDTKVFEIKNSEIVNMFELPTAGVVYLSFLEKSGIIISGSYSNGDIFLGEKNIFSILSAHCVISDISERFLYVTDIKADKIFIYDLLNHILVDEVILPSGIGPRHLKFYKEFLFLVTEYSSEIFIFHYDSITGKLEFLNKCDSITKKTGRKNYAAAIDIKDDILVVSNRGENVISFFSIKEDGVLIPIGEVDCFGDWPRDIKFYKEFLFVANERSNEICVIDKNYNLVCSIPKDGVNFILMGDE